MKYRLYIDESGALGYSSKPLNEQNFKERYLSLTGIIVEDQDNENILQPEMLNIRRLFTDDPDTLPILHRDEICKKEGLFIKLNDADFKTRYTKALESLIDGLPFKIITIVVDKAAHKEKYGAASMNPYHYSIDLLLERYVKYLQPNKSTGDVMIEARGKKEDRLLQQEYTRFYTIGTYYIPASAIQNKLTSKKIKVKDKKLGIAGLQLADSLSLPSKLDVLKTYKVINKDLVENYTKILISKIQSKYHKNGYGTVIGVGKKLV